MRWTALFEDLEAQLDAATRVADDAEIADRVRRGHSEVPLADRLRGQLGLTLRVSTFGGEVFQGQLTHVGAEWLVLRGQTAEIVVPLTAIRFVDGLSRTVAVEKSQVLRALGLGSVLRTLARDRARVVIHTVDGGPRLEGVIDRVGKDFAEIAVVLPGEARRAATVSAVYAVPFAGIAAVSSR